ncbi:DUF5914 domain-containing protein [Allostreptomyces psammosilenae]|uniref:Rieske domain-containing protein n=1 Tax=Allostreptomyces psammosilenae TaxID=1892865 RepID=A0A852ZQ27_9ACTN|nr:DUF5914 domain-containing protein [Allostreptomyces psammosilenae]NYI03597.1 hypothetical protein [Allostreptomyces psammosilenae]
MALLGALTSLASLAAPSPSGSPPFVRRRPVPWDEQPPTWRQARPRVIEAALDRARRRPSGNWFVLAASREIRADRPFGRTVAGVEVVAWRGADGRAHAAPGACPHLGAPLCRAPIRGGRLVCHWHGMALGPDGAPGWVPFPVHEDGVLTWVRLDEAGGEAPLDRPVLPPGRPEPADAVTAVATMVGRCEPDDVLANRLDPWHGAWFHPYSFADLRVLAGPDAHSADHWEGDAAGRLSGPDPLGPDRFLVEVTFTLSRRVGVPVRAEFTCPDPRTVVMRVVEGEGTGSMVETHATPLGPARDGTPRTAVIEAVIARSDRPGFAAARGAAPLLRPLMRAAARRLWRDDLAYAERRWELRTKAGG